MRPLEWSESRGALRDLHALGVEVTQARAESRAYAAIGGRSERRWWLLPTRPRVVSAASYGLFQPVLSSARFLTKAAVVTCELGLAKLAARSTVRLAGENALSRLFPNGCARHFAYFSGTPGPHQKLVVQVMAGDGHILGYGKATCNAKVAKLLQHEADVLDRISSVALRSARVPRVLYSGAIADATILLTDTLKTGYMPASTCLSYAHCRFLEDLTELCRPPSTLDEECLVLYGLRRRLTAVSNVLTPRWRRRIEEAIARIDSQSALISSYGLTHGDFTPWNSLTSQGQLFVFDWEYAGWDYPTDYDLIHFLSATPQFFRASAELYVERMLKALTTRFNRTAAEARARLLAYLCTHSLRYACRVPRGAGGAITWSSADRSAVVLDALLAKRPR